MSNDGGDDKGPSEFDRMSLNSLKRELEVQKTKSEVARDEAQRRIHEAKKSKTPWGAILGIAGGTVVLLAIGFFFVRSQLPRDWNLPEFILPDIPDGGQWHAPVIPVIEDSDGGTSTGTTRHPRRPQQHDNLNKQLDLGNDNDPLHGL